MVAHDDVSVPASAVHVEPWLAERLPILVDMLSDAI
jgi:hypothetical protein